MRLIDADKLLARYKAGCEGCKETQNYCEHCCDIADVISDIEDAPTVDLIPEYMKHYRQGLHDAELKRNGGLMQSFDPD